MANEDRLLYQKLRDNVIKYSPKRMLYLEDESDDSSETRNNTLMKAKLTTRVSNFLGQLNLNKLLFISYRC